MTNRKWQAKKMAVALIGTTTTGIFTRSRRTHRQLLNHRTLTITLSSMDYITLTCLPWHCRTSEQDAPPPRSAPATMAHGNLHVGNLDIKVTDAELQQAFERFGPVCSLLFFTLRLHSLHTVAERSNTSRRLPIDPQVKRANRP